MLQDVSVTARSPLKEAFFKKRFNLVVLTLLAVAGSVLFHQGPAQGTWLIDAGRFHVSVHGQMSCLDCHEAVADRALHPDPGDIARTGKEFFKADHCVTCHENVPGELEEGLHGGEKVQDPSHYRACLECHNPHYQTQSGEGREKGFDPALDPVGQCGACHEERSRLPEPSEGDTTCLECHLAFDTADPGNRKRVERICFHCHADGDSPAAAMTRTKVPALDAGAYGTVPHAQMTCTVCHSGAVSPGHRSRDRIDCKGCHIPHDEKTAHDAHLGVDCGACHLREVIPFRDPESGRVTWKRQGRPGGISSLHEMRIEGGEKACLRCHTEGNQVGASALVLPPKGILCMPCHTATFSVGDPTTVISILVFIAGMVLTFAYVLTGSMEGGADETPVSKFLRMMGLGLRAVFSPWILPVVKALFLDVLLQRRLYRQSPGRWLVHGLIFWPFVFRFCWGAAGLLGSLLSPEWNGVWALLDKNHPVTAFLFDLSGLILLLGIVLAFIRGHYGTTRLPEGLPGRDSAALALIGGIALCGFVLEGMRIAMTGAPPGAGYGFIGYGISGLFSAGKGITTAYGYIWYVHAVLTGMFVAYLPFSRLVHIIMAPLVLAMNAVAGRGRGKI